MTSKEKAPSYGEWVKDRQFSTNELRARASAYHDSARADMKGFWTWFRDISFELNNVFHALEWVDGEVSLSSPFSNNSLYSSLHACIC